MINVDSVHPPQKLMICFLVETKRSNFSSSSGVLNWSEKMFCAGKNAAIFIS